MPGLYGGASSTVKDFETQFRYAEGMARKPRPDAAQVQSVVRTLHILEVLAADGELGLTALAARVGIHKSTLFRFLRTLCALGYARRDPDTERFSLSLKVFELGAAVHARVDLVKLAAPFLARLSSTTGEAVHLAVLDGDQLVYLSKIESTRALRVAMRSGVGLTAPAYCTGVGKVLLAFAPAEVLDAYLARCAFVRHTEKTVPDRRRLLAQLQQIQDRGWAVDDEEHEHGVRCVAAPLRDRTGAVVAALSISGPTLRLTQDRIDAARKLVCEVAAELSGQLGFTPRRRSPPGATR
jgi:DNA-binding IclR family transcriptional regulator